MYFRIQVISINRKNSIRQKIVKFLGNPVVSF